MAPLLPPPLRNVKEPLPLKTRPPFEIRLQNTHFVPDNVTERSMPLRSKLTALASEALSPKAKSELIDNGLNTKSSFIVIVLGPCEAYSCTLPDIVALTENDPVQSSAIYVSFRPILRRKEIICSARRPQPSRRDIGERRSCPCKHACENRKELYCRFHWHPLIFWLTFREIVHCLLALRTSDSRSTNSTGIFTATPGAAGFSMRATSAFTASRPIAAKS